MEHLMPSGEGRRIQAAKPVARLRGFTLIELMIVMAVIAILDIYRRAHL